MQDKFLSLLPVLFNIWISFCVALCIKHFIKIFKAHEHIAILHLGIEMLKEGDKELIKLLTILVIKCLENGQIPKEWNKVK